MHFPDTIFEISDQYDAFLIDQWGVLHDGYKPYPVVIKALARLKSKNKHIIVLSNSGARASENEAGMAYMGIDNSLYNEVITSGEATWKILQVPNHPLVPRRGNNVYLISMNNNPSILQGVPDMRRVMDIDLADFIILSGTDSGTHTLDSYKAILHKARENELPIICSNPDVSCVLGDEFIMTPGALAKYYRDIGGTVHYIGKPYPLVYDLCFDILAQHNITKDKTVMIGDSMDYDIAGGKNAGIDTCMVLSGMHRRDFAYAQNKADFITIFNDLGYAIYPDYILQSLK